MYSSVIPLAELKQRSAMYWLPPCGRDNGVWADTWTCLPDIETDDVTAVLGLLADADVGGYAAISRGRNGRTDGYSHLYVDMMCYHRAEDVLMLYMRAKGPRADHPRTAAKKPATCDVTPMRRTRGIAPVISQVIGGLMFAALIALGLTFAYTAGPAYHPCVHPSPHRLPAATYQIVDAQRPASNAR